MVDVYPDKKLRPWSDSQVDEILATTQDFLKDFDIGQTEATFTPQLDFPDKPILILLMTDPHYGSIFSNVEMINRHFDLVANTPNTYVVINGDDTDNFNATGKWASAMMENPVPPQQVSRAWFEKVKPLDEKGKIGAMGFGNHNDFGGRAGQDWYDSFLGQLRAPIFTTGGLLHIKMDVTYDLAMTHMYWGSSKLNPTNACKRFLDFEYPEADIVFLGHTHVSEGLHFEKGGKDRIGVIGGTYKEVDPWARKRGIGGSSGRPGHALMLYPNERKMEHFKSIEVARDILSSYFDEGERV
jgi:hypothetical protein